MVKKEEADSGSEWGSVNMLEHQNGFGCTKDDAGLKSGPIPASAMNCCSPDISENGPPGSEGLSRP